MDDPRIARAYVFGRQLVRRTVNSLTSKQLGWVADLHSARWLDSGLFQLSGWAYERGYGFTEQPRVRVWARTRGVPPVELDVVGYDESLANGGLTGARDDYSRGGFVATVDPTRMLEVGRPGSWRLEIEVIANEHRSKGRFNRRTALSSARYLHPRTYHDGVQVLPSWTTRNGLTFEVGRPPVRADSVTVEGRTVTAELVCFGIDLATAELSSDQGVVAMTVTELGPDRYRVAAELPPIEVDAWGAGATLEGAPQDPEEVNALPVLAHHLRVHDRWGREFSVRSTTDPIAERHWPARPPFAYTGLGGTVQIRDTEAMMMVTFAEAVSEPEQGVRIRGLVLGDLDDPQLTLEGARARRPLTVQINPDGSFEAAGSWLASAWGRPGLPPMPGRYTLRGETADGRRFRVVASTKVIAEAPRRRVFELFSSHFGVGAGRRLAWTLGPSQTPQEYGSVNQRRLRALYTSKAVQPEEQFYFESFRGRLATCNPLALDRALAEKLPEMPRYWGINDASVPVPEGAIPVVRGTEAWWAARQGSRFVVTNEWLGAYTHLPHQLVLQTWHGTMFKRIGLDRPTVDVVVRRQLLKERAKWDFLLSQNPHSTEIFRSAYAWEKEIWTEGYPRNDVLSTEPREPIRRLLGIGDDVTALLYAPTWREDRSTMVTFLELDRLMADLGEGYVLLLRGHSRTMGHGREVRVPGVIDVTSYPDIADLYLAADALITDYSSVMFDFSVTGRPMLFFVPDLEQYRGELRGVYFDLAETAPGPLLDTQDDVVDAIVSMREQAPEFAAKYLLWQERFNPLDDGHSAQRVLDRLLAQG